MHLQLLALDWNGTVMADLERSRLAANDVLAARALENLDGPMFLERFKLPLSEFFSDLGVETADLAAAELEWNRACMALPAPVAAGAIELLEECARNDIPVGVVSGAALDLVSADIENLQISGLISWVAGSSSNKHATLTERIGWAGRRAAFVGDTVHDIKSAKAAGVVSVGITGGYNSAATLRAASPDLLIDSLLELTALGWSTETRTVAHEAPPFGTATAAPTSASS